MKPLPAAATAVCLHPMRAARRRRPTPTARLVARLLGGLLAGFVLNPFAAAGAPDRNRVEALIVKGTNEFRRSADLPPVARNAQLTSAAADFAAYMARTDRYGHEADGRSPAQRATAHGYDYCIVLENIAYEQSSVGFDTVELAADFVDGWRRSPPHRRNMLDPAVVDTGVAVGHSARTGRYYGVQLFGLPHAARISFSIANRARSPVRYTLGEKSFRLEPGAVNTHEQCTPPALTLRTPGGRADVRVQPKDGQRFAVVPDGAGGLQLQIR
jgi:uncharacterized protein YkwD